MELNIFEKIKNDIESNHTVKKFIEELSDFFKKAISPQNNNENIGDDKALESDNDIKLEKSQNENRKEGHLYLVTEDRGNEIYLWDFTDKPKNEFKEIISSEELLSVAKEGAMLQFKNGKYELYSTDGYDMLYNEEK